MGKGSFGYGYPACTIPIRVNIIPACIAMPVSCSPMSGVRKRIKPFTQKSIPGTAVHTGDLRGREIFRIKNYSGIKD